MKKLNYEKLMTMDPTVYAILINREGQEMELVEHPTRGDEHPVIIIYHAEKLAVVSDFFDTDDMMAGGDYEPIYQHGDIHMAFELGH